MSRLDRLDQAHVELALNLYNDVELLREILRMARVPEGAERACISLGDAERGPFLIVTRGGRFVTCLGEGMRPGPHPIVTRAQLDAVAAQMTELRARIEMTRRLTGRDTPSTRLLARLVDAGMTLSREEFSVIAAWARPLRSRLIVALMKACKRADLLRSALLTTTRATSKNEKVLRELWNSTWAVHHLMMLISGEVRELCASAETLPEEELAQVETLMLSIAMTSMRDGMVATAARGLYWTARCGKFVLRRWKRVQATSGVYEDVFAGATNLAVIGLRHERLAAEVRKTLGSHGSDDPAWDPFDGALPSPLRDEYAPAIQTMMGHFRACIDDAFDRPDAVLAAHLAAGRGLSFSRLGGPRPTGARRFAAASEIPPELALPVLATSWRDVLDGGGLGALLTILPWVARAKAEDFYVPAADLGVLDGRFRPRLALDYLELQRRRTPKSQPEVVAPKPGRNEACSCASGKKYKRCCAA